MNKLLTCKLCGFPSEENSIEYRNNIWPIDNLFKDLRLNTCNKCGLGSAAPVPRKIDLDNFYENNYRSKISPFHIDFTSMIRPLKRDHRSISQLLLALQFKQLSNGDVFIDLGPGRGTSFEEINKMFEPNYLECWAIEYSLDAAAYYKQMYGVETHTNLNEMTKLKKKQVDLLLSSHSLEHFTFNDAVNFLNDLHDSMTMNGCAIFEVPHVDLRIHEKVRGGDDPHLLFFSKDSLKMLFEKCEFEVLFIETCGPKYNQNNGNSLNHAFKNKLKTTLKKTLNIFPLLGNVVSSIFSDQRIDLMNENFSYGGNRSYLRIVVKPKKLT